MNLTHRFMNNKREITECTYNKTVNKMNVENEKNWYEGFRTPFL